jgi:hypothetical protein
LKGLPLKGGDMTGERDLRKLLQHMTPQLHPDTFVFCSFPACELPLGLEPMATFREAEGLSAIVTKNAAQRAGVSCEFESRLITLTVHSSLDAVGFLAAVLAVLADAGIPCNAVSAFHHDHLFVPREAAQKALELLAAMAAPTPENSGPNRPQQG